VPTALAEAGDLLPLLEKGRCMRGNWSNWAM
jgi:hypothetical protein